VIYIKTLDINSQTFDLNKNYEEGFLKVSAWNNIYSFFKYEPKDINNNNDLEKLIYIYQIYSFISLELTLFIGTHPNNKEAINTLNNVNNNLTMIKDKLEENNIVFTHCSIDSADYFSLKTPWSGN
jgi:hypothetical protein